ncbi:uncharacterized protein Tco025E_09445 [Trypanosoma conorhini]|uniref:Uncharacterized protein n=1 Tax=Trypanosoma conorhini TaxID=83891 RepID=A0A422MWB1_9TRYP|nr:uncharacterized protein Tco025E_09445 [Trypanosoma conorhini]RNE97469.1 hypothetical protein Tco025E_09445 [Trypanosoma conorhini]
MGDASVPSLSTTPEPPPPTNRVRELRLAAKLGSTAGGFTPLDFLLCGITLFDRNALHQQKTPASHAGKFLPRLCRGTSAQQHVDIVATHKHCWPHYVRCLVDSRLTSLHNLCAKPTCVRRPDFRCAPRWFPEALRRNPS